jgi:hypothetical protein
MSSRILQEDNSLLLTEANEPLVNENFIAVDGFSTGSPTVTSATIAQVHVATVLDIATGLPIVASASLTQDHNLVPLSVALGSPSVPSLTLVQDHSLAGDGVASASPEVSSVTMAEEETAIAEPIITGVVGVSDVSLSQTHVLSANKIRTRSPVVGTADDPNYIVKQEIEELQQMFGGWNRRIYEVPDGRLVQAEREIQATFGDVVSIDKKAKSLLKFGKSAELAANTIETVWSHGGHEVYVQDNLIDSISSSNIADNEEIYLECHTVEGTGTDQKFTFMTQTVSLNGTTRVPLPTPVARVSKAYNNNGTELLGAVYVYQDTALTNGVPTDRTKVHAHIPQGFQQSFKGATTFSDEDYYILTGGFGSVSNKQAASVDFYLEVRAAGKIFRQGAAVSASSTGGSWDIDLDPCIIIPKNADIRITCETATQGAVVFGSFKGYLAKVIG